MVINLQMSMESPPVLCIEKEMHADRAAGFHECPNGFDYSLKWKTNIHV